MTSSAAQLANATTVEIDVPGSDNPGIPTTIYTLIGNQPARIETVHFIATSGEQDISSLFVVLRLVDVSGLVLFAQPTPQFNSGDPTDTVTLEMTWARGANDSASFTAFGIDVEGGSDYYGWAVMPLPDLVIQGNSYITAQSYGGADDTDEPLILNDIAVTYTVGADPTATVADILPLLVPTTNG